MAVPRRRQSSPPRRHESVRRSPAAALLLLGVLGTLATTACDRLPGDGGDGPGPTGGAGGPHSGRAISPLLNPRGTGPGLAPVTAEADTATARRVIEKLTTRGRGPRTGYDRDEFGYAWMDTADGVPLARNGCDTRNDLLKLHGRDVRFRAGSDCVVVSMHLYDPYTGKDIAWRKAKAAEIQIDHVVPLSYSWQMGSARWDDDKRRRFANDPLNLLPVDGPANSAKGDSGPASWLPPARGVRCAYVLRFAQVADKYELAVTPADKRVMTTQCGG